MNGAESLVRTLVASGVTTCFANPGTSEMHFVAAVDKVEGMRTILGLFEGAVTGMADGYGRMSDSPAATLLHLGPGLANGLANLHNARRAATPIVNIVGNHATYHEQYDPPLTSDVAGFARPVSAWIHSSPSARDIAADAARAVQASLQPPGQIATLILPADTAWSAAERPAAPLPRPIPAPVDGAAVDQVAEALRLGKKSMILLRGAALREDGLLAAAHVASLTGVRLACDTFVPRWQRGAGRPVIEQIPYFAEQIVDFMKDVELLILVGAKPPVSFFAYPGKPSWCTPADCQILHLAHPHEDGVGALQALAEAFGPTAKAPVLASFSPPDLPTGPLNAVTVAQVIGALLPEQAIVSDEAATSGVALNAATSHAAPHDWLALTGGSIGQGIPLAAGAAVACPDRKVVCLHGDGGAMYTLQALWTQARENLDVTTVIFANRSYAILNVELWRVGVEDPGPKALSMLDLHNPALDWQHLATGLGVEASRATTIEEFTDQFGQAMRQRGPRLIEVVL
ncbi:decarboxylase [Mycobacteroides immunogenum]|uniref:acetolactate synthase n=1 Tax=Mycobacteroides immunogenum TaxID=83262 RepID=A0A179V9Z4_9MYCO|nr:acetolactate synthase large subunit [Mycobacteroides immunogenum]OAT67972.1 decarboxylase [Mycobacteroides immunogenum]